MEKAKLMTFRIRPTEWSALFRAFIKWTLLGAGVGVLAGSASALFLRALSSATDFRESRPALLWGLPFAGIAIGVVYSRYGKSVEAGSNLLLERVHNPEAAIPFRMVPLVLISTVVTHLFGGSAGREGTAIQMGGTFASLLQAPLRLSNSDHRILIMSGISGGFGSVFGTPLAGTIFGMEVLTMGRMRYEGLIPCLVASLVGDVVCKAWGVTHHIYLVPFVPRFTPSTWALVLIFGVLCAAVSSLFVRLSHGVGHYAKAWIAAFWARPFLGGCLIISLTHLCGTRAYLGLSLPLIERSFTTEGVYGGAFGLKILFTAITLGTGFKGGEVTPLFCIGATLGAAFAKNTGQPTAFFAALGFVAVFAGAANTPIACIVMGLELFGSAFAAPLAAACLVCYSLSGHRGIYSAQRVHHSKAALVAVDRSLSEGESKRERDFRAQSAARQREEDSTQAGPAGEQDSGEPH